MHNLYHFTLNTDIYSMKCMFYCELRKNRNTLPLW